MNTEPWEGEIYLLRCIRCHLAFLVRRFYIPPEWRQQALCRTCRAELERGRGR